MFLYAPISVILFYIFFYLLWKFQHTDSCILLILDLICVIQKKLKPFFFIIFFSYHFTAGYHGDKVQYCTVQQELFFSGYAQIRESHFFTFSSSLHPLPCLKFSTPVLCLAFLPIFLLICCICSFFICLCQNHYMGLHTHVQRNEDTCMQTEIFCFC